MLHRRKCPAFSLTELLVVICVITILAAFLLPVLVLAQARSRQATCVARERQLCVAVAMYTQDNDEMLPFSWNLYNGKPGWWWTAVLLPYIRHGEASDYNLSGFLGCPAATWPDRLAYAANPQLMVFVNGPYAFPSSTRPLASVEAPAGAVLFGDCSQVEAWRNTPENFQPINERFWVTPPEGLEWRDLDRDAQLESWPPTDPAYGQIRYRHQGGANLAYLDGHVKWWARGLVPREQFFPPPEIVYDRIGY